MFLFLFYLFVTGIELELVVGYVVFSQTVLAEFGLKLFDYIFVLMYLFILLVISLH